MGTHLRYFRSSRQVTTPVTTAFNRYTRSTRSTLILHLPPTQPQFIFNTVNMRFTAAVAAAGLAGAATAAHMGNSTMAASASDVYVTDVVTAYTTYCPEPTKITHKGETYTVSEATTLTITNCPGGCTVTKPASSAVVSSAPAVPETTAPVETAPVETTPVPLPSPSGAPYYPSANGTNPTAPYGSGVPAGTGAPAGTGSSATGSSTAPAYTGAANQAYLSASAGFLALFGLVAAF